MPIQIMLVDDSSVVRSLLTRALHRDPSIKVVATAQDGEQAIVQAKTYQPDIVLLDIEMPKMDGLTALPKILGVSPKSKVIMASRLTRKSAKVSIEALELGATDYIRKPEMDELDGFYVELIAKIKAIALPASASTLAPAPRSIGGAITSAPASAATSAPSSLRLPSTRVVRALGVAASTGGPQALLKMFTSMQGHLRQVPIFVTQHMPAAFTSTFAERLGNASGFPCTEGVDGDPVRPGHIYVAPGNFHMTVRREGPRAVIRVNQDAPENFCRPAADPMFRSLSDVYGSNTLAVVLTGMGQDGMAGARVIIEKGGSVVAQDAASSVVYGMPKAVVDQGFCEAVLPLDDIGPYLIKRC